MASLYLFKEKRMNTTKLSLSPSDLDNPDQNCAQLITNYKVKTVNYTGNDCVSKDAVRGIDTPLAINGCAQEGVEANGLDEVSEKEQARITGIRAQIALNVSQETGRVMKSSYKCYLTVQTNLAQRTGSYVRLTGYLQIRRNNFTRCIRDDTSRRALQHYHRYRDYEDEVYLGHCHLRREKKMQPGMAVLWCKSEPFFTFYCGDQDFQIMISSDELSPRQRAANMLYDGYWGEVNLGNQHHKQPSGLDAILSAPHVGGHDAE
jgi:hypothetical protein